MSWNCQIASVLAPGTTGLYSPPNHQARVTGGDGDIEVVGRPREQVREGVAVQVDGAGDADQAPAELALQTTSHTTSWAVGTTETSLLHAEMLSDVLARYAVPL